MINFLTLFNDFKFTKLFLLTFLFEIRITMTKINVKNFNQNIECDFCIVFEHLKNYQKIKKNNFLDEEKRQIFLLFNILKC